jgi:hypothetical protein
LQVPADLYCVLVPCDGLQYVLRKVCLTMHNIQSVSYEQILEI